VFWSFRVEEDLVQDESPFKGSKRFGMCFATAEGLATYGTVLEIVKHTVLPDGRLLVLTKGRDRFKIEKIVQEKPVLLCDVNMIDDSEDEEALRPSAEKAKELFRNLLQLNAKYKKLTLDEATLVRMPAMPYILLLTSLGYGSGQFCEGTLLLADVRKLTCRILPNLTRSHPASWHFGLLRCLRKPRQVSNRC
jgi:hypothetical protein